MQAQVHFLGHRFATGVFVKGDRFLQGIHKDQAGMTVFHMPLQILAELRVQLTVDVFRELSRISLPPISNSKVLLRIPSGHMVVQVKQKMHSVERTRCPLFTYSMILMFMGHTLTHAPHCEHFSCSPSILVRANLEVVFIENLKI
jgi:hypothetical protein